MEYRKIRPSFGDGSASNSNPNQSASDSTGSGPRRPQNSEKETPETSNTASKRRRVPKSVTRNACLNCKKARAKCDGKKPCQRCAARIESECVYEIHIKHAKEELVKQIKELRTRAHLTDQILQALSRDEKVPEILERLKNGETYDSIVEWLGRVPMEEVDTLSPQESSQHSAFETSDHEMGGMTVPKFRWTSVTSDRGILDHLFQLYFAWIHPVHTLFSEGRFVDCYKRQSDQYCSPVLVNAICAMACHLHSVTGDMELDFELLGGEFSRAVGKTIDAKDGCVTTIQAFAVMFLVDCAEGKGLRASVYLKMATENLPGVEYQTHEGFGEVWKYTARGIRNLNIEWGQVTCQVPADVTYAPYGEIEEDDERLDEANWWFYRNANDECPSQPGLMGTTNRQKSKLTALVQEMITLMYSSEGPLITARDVLQQYNKFVIWRKELPSVISASIGKSTKPALPHVLSLLILYSNALIQLLRPLLDLPGFPAFQIEGTIWRHAQHGLFLIDVYLKTQYARYQPVLQMFHVLHLTDVIARFAPGGTEGGHKDGPEAIQFGMEALMQSKTGFPVAGPLQEMLRRTALECSIRIPLSVTSLMLAPKPPKETYQIDDIMDACTRRSYTQPIEQIHKRYIHSFSAEWTSGWVDLGLADPYAGPRSITLRTAEERGAQSLMQIRNLLNTG